MKRCRWPASLMLIAAFAAAPSAQSEAAIGDLLKQYADGDYAAVTQALASVTDFKSVVRQLDKVALPWIRSAKPDDVFRRRLIVAGFALEAAHAGLGQWDDARYLIE